MLPVLIFSIILMVGVLLSGLAHRSILSLSVLFLTVGFLVGEGMTGWIQLQVEDDIVKTLAEISLFAILFTDGMRVSHRELIRAWHLPGRALLLGLPLTVIIIAVLAHFLSGLQWSASFLIGAVLSPTDPVFASSLVNREEVPAKLRRLLNIESGMNDGLALPLVVILIAQLGTGHSSAVLLISEVLLGIVVGFVVPWALIRLEESRLFGAVNVYEPLFGFSIGLLVFSVSSVTHANEFLAAFVGGITIASLSERVRRHFKDFGEIIAELLKLATVFIFGALVTPGYFLDLSVWDYIFAVLVLVLARPLALSISMIGGSLGWRSWLAAAWFGPKGFASIVYAVMILDSGIDRAGHFFHLIAIVVGLSIIAHSSTDIPVARWLQTHTERPEKRERSAGSHHS